MDALVVGLSTEMLLFAIRSGITRASVFDRPIATPSWFSSVWTSSDRMYLPSHNISLNEKAGEGEEKQEKAGEGEEKQEKGVEEKGLKVTFEEIQERYKNLDQSKQ